MIAQSSTPKIEATPTQREEDENKQCYTQSGAKQINPWEESLFMADFCRPRGENKQGLRGSRSKNNIAGEVAYCVLTDCSD